jgi:putative intracellular protease/amidase
MKVLFVLTSHDPLGNTGRKTGFWLEELAAPYDVFKDAGAEITLASPKGRPATARSEEQRAEFSDGSDTALRVRSGVQRTAREDR